MELFTAHQRHLYIFIRTQLPNAADVDEVWQATNLLLWKKFAAFEPGSSFRAWAFQIARYEVLNFRARRANQAVQFSDALLEQLVAASTTMPHETDDRLDALRICLCKLTDDDRTILERRFAAGASGEAVAEELGRTPRYIYKAVSRIRRVLIECVARQLAQEDHPV
jgi:RNA polymerase sigma-70 factor (ECF subfamily)